MALLLPAGLRAQTTLCTFEQPKGVEYDSLGVYDSFITSPFYKGELKGNLAVTANDVMTEADSTAYVLAFQRSRYGSTQFGAKIRLHTPFALKSTTQYVHVYLRKPLAGRAMLIGLGKRNNRPGESDQVPQFWILSTTITKLNEWVDVVFGIKGNDDVTISSLVVVPDAESRHALPEDFVAYIDGLELSTSSAPRFVSGDYPLNFEASATQARSDRYLTGVQLTGSKSGVQTLQTGNAAGASKMYVPLLDQSFSAVAGETLTPKFNYVGTWMHGYVYADFGKDGIFSSTLNGTVPAEGSDLKSFSCYGADNSTFYNSAGTTVSSGAGVGSALPSFTVPSNQANGFYRMRYKVDWNSIDPGGNINSDNNIVSNGGCIVDTRLNVHGPKSRVSITTRNGYVLTADSTELNETDVAFGESLTILMAPAPGFKQNGITLRHGYFSGDSLVHGTPQWISETIPAYVFRNNRFTIPASSVDGDLQIIAEFAEKQGGVDDGLGDYPVNFNRDSLVITRSDRFLRGLTVTGGTAQASIPASVIKPVKVYQYITTKSVFAKQGTTLTPKVTYLGNSMDAYLYVDYDADGRFAVDISSSTHQPTSASELVSFSNVGGYNSVGVATTAHSVTLPAFTLPANLSAGVYRARLKIDWDCTDPGGRCGEKYTDNFIQDNGGEILDFLINVTDGERPITLVTQHGNIYGASNEAVLNSILPGSAALTFVPTAVKPGYQLQQFIIRHGYNLQNDPMVHGTPQWTTDTITTGLGLEQTTYQLAQTKVDGDVEVTALFKNVSSTYKNILDDEFDIDGQPKSTTWHRCTRASSAWSRFLSNSNDVVYQQDGNLVLRAIPNLNKTSDNVDMLTGGIESSGRFTFNHGFVECRAKVNSYTGNFPAIWMMPADGTGGWPTCGEIDIMEQINAENKAYHTVHSHWTWDLGNKTNPTSSFNEAVDMSVYHTYGLEKMADTIRWYVDGVQKGQYYHVPANDASGQWPFDKAFYLILNQSVGNGSWAANPDVTHTYEFDVDWIRVYQSNASTGIEEANAAAGNLQSWATRGHLFLRAQSAVKVLVSDMAGRTVYNSLLQGTVSLPLSAGIYVVGQHKVLVP